MEKEQEGGIVVGKRKMWSISCADDIVLMAKGEEKLKRMLNRLEKFLRSKKLDLSSEKSKILVFGKGRGKAKKREWYWKGQRMEEVKEIKYLGFWMQKNGGAELHLKDRRKKTMLAMKETWRIGEKIFKDNFEKRMKLFDALVRSVALYGTEIWGWFEDDRLDGIMRKYIKWSLKLDRETPNYITLEECKLIELRLQALRKAIKYEEKESESSKELVRECIKITRRQKHRREEGIWERKRREKVMWTEEELTQRREEGLEELIRKAMEIIWEKEKQERKRRIKKSRYNKFYDNLVKEEIPKYLKGVRKNKERIMIAKFRCGNEVKGSKFWKEESERKCRICEEKEETIKHMFEECEKTKQMERGEVILGEDGQGVEFMRKVMEERKKKEEKKMK